MTVETYVNIPMEVEVDVVTVLTTLRNDIVNSCNIRDAVIKVNAKGKEELVVYRNDNYYGEYIEIGRYSDKRIIERYKEGKEIIDALSKIIDYVNKEGEE